jgi:long-chain acyl-CoA synthetase
MIATGGPRNSEPGTLNQLFFDAVETYRKPDALQVKRNGRYEPISHETLADRVRRTALGLTELGVRPGDRVAILSENRPEWAIADFACLMMGASDVPIYPNLPPEQIAYILRDSGSVIVFVSNAEQAAKIAAIRAECPTLHHVVTFAESATSADMTMAALEASGAPVDNEARRVAYRARALAVRPGDLATIIYTSGTTGMPKGCRLTHDNLLFTARNVYRGPLERLFEVENRAALLFLPLAHSFARIIQIVLVDSGTVLAHTPNMKNVAPDLQAFKPTFLLGVPRVFEKIYNAA